MGLPGIPLLILFLNSGSNARIFGYGTSLELILNYKHVQVDNCVKQHDCSDEDGDFQ